MRWGFSKAALGGAIAVAIAGLIGFGAAGVAGHAVAQTPPSARMNNGEAFYRMGGEEFLAIMPGVDLAAGIAFAECMREVVEACEPGGLIVTASFGVSVGIGDDLDFRPLYRAADAELYRSKKAGRNRVSAAGTTFARWNSRFTWPSPSAAR